MGFSLQKARLKRLGRKSSCKKERKPLGSLAGRGTFDLAPLVAFEMSSVLEPAHSAEYTWGSKIPTKESPPSEKRNDITPFCGYEKNLAVNGGLEREIHEDDERDEKENLRRSTGNTPRSQTLNKIEPIDRSVRNIRRTNAIKKKRGRSALYELTSLIDDDSKSFSSVDNHLDLDEEEEDINGVKNHVACIQSKLDKLGDQNESENVKKIDSKDQWIRSTSTERSPQSSRVKEQKTVNKNPVVATVPHPGGKIQQCVCRTMENVEVAVLQVTKECDKVMHKLTGERHEWLWD